MKRSYYLRRIIPCALITVVCLVVVIMSINVIGFTDRQRMRLAEKAHMVGPSVLLGREEALPVWGDVLIGRSDYGYSLFCCDSGEFYYHKKGENYTIFSPMSIPKDFDEYAETIPIFLFVSAEKAVHAKLKVSISSNKGGDTHEWLFYDEKTIHSNGYFLLSLPLGENKGDYFIDILKEMLNQQPIYSPFAFGSITVELYDKDGTLIDTYIREFPLQD